MLREGMTVREAAQEWVDKFNAIPYGMIEKLMRIDRPAWREITVPTADDRVFAYKNPDLHGFGRIHSIGKKNGGLLYEINLDDGQRVEATEDEIELQFDGLLPMWGWLWQFNEGVDDSWLAEPENLRAMCRCGFRVYEHDEWGYFFGIDGVGYDFYNEHWIPLYKARGLLWHDSKAEKEAEMRRKGYHRGQLGVKTYGWTHTTGLSRR